jgi:hypothetical protein
MESIIARAAKIILVPLIAPHLDVRLIPQLSIIKDYIIKITIMGRVKLKIIIYAIEINDTTR